MRVDLPSGGWAELREVSEISERARRPIGAALSQLSEEALKTMSKLEPLMSEGANTQLKIEDLAKLDIHFGPADLKLFEESNDYCVVAMVKAWSFDEPISIDSVLERSGPDYDKLRKVCSVASASLFVDFTMTKENVENVDSPFGPSNGSATSSKVPEPSLTSASPSPSTESTVS